MPRRDAQTKMHALTPTLSRGVHQHRLEPDDDGLIFPSLTEAEAHTDAFQAVSPTGLVAASEAEQLEVTGGLGTRASSLTALGVDEKGGEMEKGGDEAKLVTWTEDDPENPRNFSILTKWSVLFSSSLPCESREKTELSFAGWSPCLPRRSASTSDSRHLWSLVDSSR